MSGLSKPAEGGSGGIAQYEGCLLILTLTGRGESRYENNMDNPLKPFVDADVVVVDSPKQGKLGTQTSSSRPKEITGTPGEKNSIRMSQGFLVGAFKGKNEGEPICGRISVEFTDNKGGKDKPQWLISATDEELAECVAYLDRKPTMSKAEGPAF